MVADLDRIFQGQPGVDILGDQIGDGAQRVQGQLAGLGIAVTVAERYANVEVRGRCAAPSRSAPPRNDVLDVLAVQRLDT